MDLSAHLHNGKLLRFGDGGYPLWYLARDGNCLCAECATDAQDEIDGVEANYEDVHLYCNGCGSRIESAYADDCVLLADKLRDLGCEDCDAEWFVGWDSHSEIGSVCNSGRRHIDSVLNPGGIVLELQRESDEPRPHGYACMPQWQAARALARRRAFIGYSRYDALPEDCGAAALETATSLWGGCWEVLEVYVIDATKED